MPQNGEGVKYIIPNSLIGTNSEHTLYKSQLEVSSMEFAQCFRLSDAPGTGVRGDEGGMSVGARRARRPASQRFFRLEFGVDSRGPT